MEGARTLIHSKRNLPLTLWAEAVSCVTYTLNRTLSSTHSNKTPYEYGKKLNLSNLRIFGSEFYTLIPKEIRRKLDPKGLLCYFVGNSDTQKGDRYWNALTGKVNISRDVTPSRHHYEKGLPQEDRQNGLDVFPTNEPLAPSTPEVPT